MDIWEKLYTQANAGLHRKEPGGGNQLVRSCAGIVIFSVVFLQAVSGLYWADAD